MIFFLDLKFYLDGVSVMVLCSLCDYTWWFKVFLWWLVSYWWFLLMLRCFCLHLDKKKCLYTKTCLCFQVQTQAFFLVDVSYRWNWLVSKYKHKQVSCYLNPVRLTQAFFLVNVSYDNDEVKKNDFGVAFPNGVAIKILILQPLKLQPCMIKLLMWNYILSLLLSRCIFNV